MSLTPQASGGRQPMGPADRPLPVPSLSDPETLFLTNDHAADPDLVVGVVDTGIALVDGAPHPYLQDHLYEVAEIDEWTAADPYRGHGSFVAARILMEAPTATIDLRGPLGRSSDDPATDDRAVADAIRGLAETHQERLAVVNLSFAGYWDEITGPVEIRKALTELAEQRGDLLVVASTANRWIDQPSWPAAFTDDLPTVLAVGPADETVVSQDQEYALIQPPAAFASRWPRIDVYGSAVRVLGPTPAGGWCRWSGSSFAAASVSGILADLRARPDDWIEKVRERDLINGKPYLRSAEASVLGQVGGGDG